MPQRDQHTANAGPSQAQEAVDRCWEELVQQRLPAELEAQARSLGAFQRVRGVSSASQLLRALLCSVLSLTSLKELSGWSRLIGVTRKVLSAQAWHKRVRQSADWMLWLFAHLLQVRLSTSVNAKRQRILLVDATHLAEMGPKGENWSLHCAYELETGQLSWVRVTDHHTGEGFTHLPLQPGDILVGDGAYSRATQLLAADAAQAFSLTRFSPQHLPVFASTAPSATPEFRVNIVGWLQALRPGTYERRATVWVEGKRLPVRLIAVAFPEAQAEALREQKRRQARDKGRKLSEQAIFLAGFHLIVTTLPEKQWPAALVLDLYACRWQIEILFKRIKQVLETHRLPCRCPQMAQAMIAALLVAWLLIEDEATELRRQITDAEPLTLPVSSWQLNQWAKAGLQHVVVGWWSPQQLRALIPELRRLFSDKRRRPLREHQRRVRFHTLLAGASDLVSVFDCSGTLS
ncbi:MAG TPA: IS4 family transposase [Ktedonobacteraceae bacterium]|nr:IS4 family transposase [Ktedonobacteraceae bacterium]